MLARRIYDPYFIEYIRSSKNILLQIYAIHMKNVNSYFYIYINDIFISY